MQDRGAAQGTPTVTSFEKGGRGDAEASSEAEGRAVDPSKKTAKDAVGGVSEPAVAGRALTSELRAGILAAPEAVLEDPEIMRALLTPRRASDRRIVDLRAAQVAQLQQQLERLRAAHRDVVESAWDHMTGVAQAESAVLALLESAEGEPADAAALAERVAARLPGVIDVDEARLCFSVAASARFGREGSLERDQSFGREADQDARWSVDVTTDAQRPRALSLNAAALAERLRRASVEPSPAEPSPSEPSAPASRTRGLASLSPQLFDRFSPKPPQRAPKEADGEEAGAAGPKAGESAGAAARQDPAAGAPASIRLRAPEALDPLVFGAAASELEAVAVVALARGPGRRPCALALGSKDPERFRAGHTVELLGFIGGVLERLLESRRELR